jgi:hypothetical protein
LVYNKEGCLLFYRSQKAIQLFDPWSAPQLNAFN